MKWLKTPDCNDNCISCYSDNQSYAEYNTACKAEQDD